MIARLPELLRFPLGQNARCLSLAGPSARTLPPAVCLLSVVVPVVVRIVVVGIVMWLLPVCGSPAAAFAQVTVSPPAATAVAPRTAERSAALSAFLVQFDGLSARGFVPTQRKGATGVGYTLESLLQIAENNSPRGDFRGMEIKAHRLGDDQSVPGKANLFLKEPEWTQPQSTADRIRQWGYRRPDGRYAWYQSVTSRPNKRGLRLTVDRQQQQLQLCQHERVIGRWSFAVLQQRLQEKLSEVVFVGARTRGTAANEEFHYTTVTWCGGPALERFLRVLEDGDIILELRMHEQDDGGGRNHGSAFRIRPRRLRDLYEVQTKCRPLIRQSATDRQ